MGLRIKVSFLFALVFSCSSVFSLQQRRGQQEEGIPHGQPYVVFLQQPQQSSNSAPPAQSWWGVFTTTVQNNPVQALATASVLAGTVTAAGWAAWKQWGTMRWRAGVDRGLSGLAVQAQESERLAAEYHVENQRRFNGLEAGQVVHNELLNAVLNATTANGAASAEEAAKSQKRQKRLQEDFVAHVDATGKAFAAAAEERRALGNQITTLEGGVDLLRRQFVASDAAAVERDEAREQSDRRRQEEVQGQIIELRKEVADRAKSDNRIRLHQELKSEVRSRKLKSDMKQGFAQVNQKLAEAKKQAEQDREARLQAEEREKEADRRAEEERRLAAQERERAEKERAENKDFREAAKLQFEQFGGRLGDVEAGGARVEKRQKREAARGRRMEGMLRCLAYSQSQTEPLSYVETRPEDSAPTEKVAVVSAPTAVAIAKGVQSRQLSPRPSRPSSPVSSPRALSRSSSRGSLSVSEDDEREVFMSPSWGLAAPLPMGFPGGTVLQIVNQRLVPDGGNNYSFGDQQHADDQGDPLKNPWKFSLGSSFRQNHALTYNGFSNDSWGHR